MAEITIYYAPETYDNISRRIRTSAEYHGDEKDILLKMLEQMKREQFLLYMVEIYRADLFSFVIPGFNKIKEKLISEVYSELIEQLVDKYKDYENVAFSDLRKWFCGMSVDIALVKELDERLSQCGVEVLY